MKWLSGGGAASAGRGGVKIAWLVQMWTACDVCRSGGGTLVGGEGNLEGRVDGVSGRCAVTCEGG